MKRAIVAGGLVFLVSLAAAPWARAQGLPLFTVDRDSDQLRTVDPLTGQTLTSVTITLGGFTIEGSSGLARHPLSGEFFVLLQVAGQTGSELARLDPANGEATRIGNTGQPLYGLTFGGEGKLYALSAETASLFLLDLRSGAARQTGTPGPGLSLMPEGATASTHWQGDFSLQAASDGSLFLVTASGGVRRLSTLDHVAAGLAFAGAAQQCTLAQLYGAAHQGPDGPSVFFSINPTNGAATMVGPIGFERVSAMDFGPGGTLFATGERMDGSNTNVLLTIDPCTGVGTEVGPHGVGNVRDLSFRNADGVLFGNFPDFGSSSTRLVTFDTGTGVATAVGGDAALFAPAGGMAFSGADTLFQVANVVLFTVDPATGASSNPVPLVYSPPANDAPRLNALDFNQGTLFASLNDGIGGPPENYLATVDTATGVVTIVGPTQGGLDALAFTSGVADLFLSKADDPDPVGVGINVTYVLTVANAGPETATGVMLTDTLPMDTTFGSTTTSQGTCAHDMGIVTCDLGTIDAQDTATVAIVAAAPDTAGPITNMASVTLNEPDPNLANNSASATTDVVDFEISIMPASVTVERGNTAVYTVTLTPLGGRFDFAIILDCEDNPTATTCIFSPPSPVPGGAPFNATLNLTTTAPPTATQPSSAPPLYAIWLLAPLGLLVLGAGRRRRALLVLVLTLVLVVLQVGCGGSAEMPPSAPVVTPIGTHTFTVRGIAGTLQRSTMAEVVVQ